MVDINWTVGVQIVNFLILIVALNIIAFKPIRKILQDRKAKMDGLADHIETADRQAGEKDTAFTSGLKEARVKGKQEKDVLLQAADDEEKAILGKINDKAREDMAEVQAKIAKDVGAVKEALENEVDSFADAIAQKILGRAV